MHYFYKKIVSIIFFATITLSLAAQLDAHSEMLYYARNVVDTMASEQMHGRGYIDNGDKLAANFIRSEFKKAGLQPLSANYFQEFPLAVNTFPFDISITFDQKELAAGVDFIVCANAASFKGKYKTVLADDELLKSKRKWKRFLKQNFADKILVINDTGKQDKALHDLLSNSLKAKAIVCFKDKLTWSVAQAKSDYAIVEVLRSKVNAMPGTVEIDLTSKFDPLYKTQNVIGFIKGKKQPDSMLVFSAHYDHLGQMGVDIYFAGANDNASGCAMLLSLAKYYSLKENNPDYSMVFIAFGAEEAGLVGSSYFVTHPLIDLKRIKFLLNMDIMGTGEDGITVVNATEYPSAYEKLKAINDKEKLLKEVKKRGKAANSDHYPFSEKGVSAFFIYTMGGIKAYHDIYDRAETLPLNEFDKLFKLITIFAEKLQQD